LTGVPVVIRLEQVFRDDKGFPATIDKSDFITIGKLLALNYSARFDRSDFIDAVVSIGPVFIRIVTNQLIAPAQV
jgi:hypothetical protein